LFVDPELLFRGTELFGRELLFGFDPLFEAFPKPPRANSEGVCEFAIRPRMIAVVQIVFFMIRIPRGWRILPPDVFATGSDVD
jgi:hypothetical protein